MKFLAGSREPFRLVIVCALALTSGATYAREEPRTSVFRVGSIKQIVIERQGSASEKSPHEPTSCDHFQLTEKEVFDYLRTTRATTAQDFHSRVNFSICVVGGRLTLEDGRAGVWEINRGRGARLDLSDGKEFFLYCAKCNGKKFFSW